LPKATEHKTVQARILAYAQEIDWTYVPRAEAEAERRGGDAGRGFTAKERKGERAMNDELQSQLLLYQTEDGKTRLEVRLENETVWLTQNQMAELFQTTKQNVSLHIHNIFAERELEELSVVKESLTTAADGKSYATKFYNLDVIISVGYRVKSHRGTQFRIWATQRLREYIVKGFALDDERLKRAGGGNYFEELLARIRDIRSSEKVFWRKVLEIYATSIDYDSGEEASQIFFATVQNKVHWATHGQKKRKNYELIMGNEE